MQELIDLISNVGFPIGITIYLLWSRGKIIDKNTEAINALRLLIEKKLK